MKYAFIMAIGALFCGVTQAVFVHPGCLSTQSDLDRMAAKVAADAQPWKASWDRLSANSHAQLGYTPNPQTTICAGGVCDSENYMRLANDCAAAYQCALRYHVSDDTRYADKAVQIMNAWASTLEGFTGDSNAGLRAGLYGYQFACAGELMRHYSGWTPADFEAFKNMMLTIFYPINSDFLIRHNNTCDSHYWANWDLAAMTSILAIGVLCDDQAKFEEAVTYFCNGIGEGAIGNAVHFVHPNGLGQWQESGRDQGHNTLGMALMGPFCEIAWNQGVDLYGYARNRFLTGCEYVAKYNLFHEVPYVTYINCERVIQPVISSGGRGNIRPGWDLLYNHYVNRLGLAAPYTQQYAEQVRPEGGGGDYGSTSGGFDSLGFTTLTHTLEPIAEGAAPEALRPFVQGRQITLSWAGSAYATSYNVKRSTTGGPYHTLATVQDTCYVDPGLTAGVTYCYVVSANNPDGESADSVEATAMADGQLHGTIIGTEGSWNNAGATRDTVFDGSLKNYFDGPSSISWAGLDLGVGVSAVVTKVSYCPRPGLGSRMVGGRFQGSNTADFSSGVTTLYTIGSAPPEEVLTSQAVSSAGAFRYLRYVGPSGGHGNAAEIRFFGHVSGLTTPAAPDGVSAAVLNGFNADIEWNAVTGATSYNIKRITTDGESYTISANVTGTRYIDAGLTAGTTCYYVVSALNSAGESAHSNEVSVMTQPAGPALTARYTFDGDVTDGSGNGYHAAVAGSPAYVTGKPGQAMDLDGAEDWVTLPSGVADYEDITIAAWIYWNGGGQWQRLFDFGNGTGQYLFLTPYSGNNTLRFAIKNGGDEQRVEASMPATGQWVHLAVTLEGTIAKLYVNGALRAINRGVTLNPEDFNPRVNYIGCSQWAADPLFNGKIDDFRIYNYALTAAQLVVVRDGGTAPSFTTDPISNLVATERADYAGNSLKGYAADVDGIERLTFSKDSGPDWLIVADDGSLSGIPGDSDVGSNAFAIRVIDLDGLSDTATMNITVANIYSGERGMEDLAGLVALWLAADCPDVPACGGADLDGDGDVDLSDFADLAGNWQCVVGDGS